MNDNKDVFIFGLVIILMAILFIGSLFGLSAIYSIYNVWSSGLDGQAELAQADYNRQIAVREAQAKMESAKLLAQAEVERAKGVAEANTIIGQSLDHNENYLRYLWIDSLSNTSNQIVYIPTEGGLPILEAGRSTKGANK